MNQKTVIIEVFRTDLTSRLRAAMLKHRLLEVFPEYEIDFDLQDCDHILRVVGDVHNERIIEIAKEMGVFVAPL